MASEVRIEQEDEDTLKVFMPYDEDAKEAIKNKFGAQWDPDDKCWVITDTPETDVERELKLHFPRAFR